MSHIIKGSQFIEAVCPALGFDPYHIRRVILDASYNGIVIAYVELVGSEELLKIDFGTYEMKIMTKGEWKEANK